MDGLNTTRVCEAEVVFDEEHADDEEFIEDELLDRLREGEERSDDMMLETPPYDAPELREWMNIFERDNGRNMA